MNLSSLKQPVKGKEANHRMDEDICKCVAHQRLTSRIKKSILKKRGTTPWNNGKRFQWVPHKYI
jgi:hypothetical protein